MTRRETDRVRSVAVILLALALLSVALGCGKPYPTASATGCIIRDTIWRSADTTLVLTLKYPEEKCPTRKP